VDDYLSEKEQVERLRGWWRENGWFLIGGVALGLLGIFGYNQYFAYKDRQAEAAGALYGQVKNYTEDNNLEQAVALLEQLRAEYPRNAYTQQAALLVARAAVVSDPERAQRELRAAMEGSSDPELAMIARLRLARVLAYREQYQDALALLDGVTEPGQFAGLINEIRGDIHAARGDADAARAAYLAAMVAPGAELIDRSFLQIKLSDLPSAAARASEGASAPAETPAAPPAAEGEGA
jgi:predicted negative regulator of RcsB-dependent stress response